MSNHQYLCTYCDAPVDGSPVTTFCKNCFWLTEVWAERVKVFARPSRKSPPNPVRERGEKRARAMAVAKMSVPAVLEDCDD